uniref:Uncharacterized protein n=1 Tax=Arundo donax TaxID=35708 RepID=A0A0A9CMG3_ARUDO
MYKKCTMSPFVCRNFPNSYRNVFF